MPDTKISNLTELAEAPSTSDELVIVDKSDTTMAASGTTKKITKANLVLSETNRIDALETVVNNASASAPASIDLHEDTDNGTNKINLTAPSAVASDKIITLPDETGTIITSVSSPIVSGWIESGETWTYASADDPTFTFTISGDKTGKYSPGMRIKLTQTTAKYFIITAVSYSSPNTTITVYGGTDYDLANATITSPYYSTQKAPLGFPLNPLKWSVIVTDTTLRSKVTSGTTVYNLGGISIVAPIGAWLLSISVLAQIGDAADAANAKYATVSLHTANNAHNTSTASSIAGADVKLVRSQINNTYLGFIMTSKTTYYLNMSDDAGSGNTVYFLNNASTLTIQLLSAYL